MDNRIFSDIRYRYQVEDIIFNLMKFLRKDKLVIEHFKLDDMMGHIADYKDIVNLLEKTTIKLVDLK